MMHQSGCADVQSHTYEHRFVPRWPAPLPLIGAGQLARCDQDSNLSMEEDFRRAKASIDGRLGKSVRHLAFPRYLGTDEAITAGVAAGYRAFWWGALPARPINRPGDPLTHIVRVCGEYLRRLPGEGRTGVGQLAYRRCGRQLNSLRARVGSGRCAMEQNQ
jgi:hypothetical protein